MKCGSKQRREAGDMHTKRQCVKNKAQQQGMRHGNLFFFFLAVYGSGKNISLAQCVACFYVYLRLCSCQVRDNTAILPKASFILPLFSSLHFHHGRKKGSLRPFDAGLLD